MCEMCELAMASAVEQPPVRTRYRVAGMQGNACVAKIDTAVRQVPGVLDVSVSAALGEMAVHHAADTPPGSAVEKAIAGLGYQISLMPEQRADLDTRDGSTGRRTNPRPAHWFRGILDLIAGRGRSTMPLASVDRALER